MARSYSGVVYDPQSRHPRARKPLHYVPSPEDQHWIDRRNQEVARLVSEGYAAKDVARTFGLGLRRVQQIVASERVPDGEEARRV